MILVTGATGFVGSALVRQVLAEGAPVRILRRATSDLAHLGEAAGRVEHAIGDVTDADSVYRAMDGVRTVYHVAAVVAFGRGARQRLRDVNVRGTAHVVNAALAEGVERLVHTSSIAALGRPERAGGVIDETAVWTPSKANTAYAVSKRDAEFEVLRGVAEGLDAVLVNPALIFGPGRPGEGTFALAERVAAGRVPLAPPGGTAVVDVEDVAAGLRLACAHGETGARYVLAAENRLWADLLQTLAEAAGAAPPRRTAPAWLLRTAGALAEVSAALTGAEPGLTRETARTAAAAHRYDGSKARRDLGLTYRPFDETARRIADALG
ncbi:NAD-dependent epimerase/dehydratase family protein [Rubrivirga marina]|uniref:Dihydroflavonol 4-reductase n=1 Tax=Rubrivirga marina TaxID=1196024 RepID=A0A271J479_9BACT|nr:NAD-dependent epimerase/dehydratase family protein [Rubrivirga marina]PAP78243.1 dihydroflavonol 4-reductase [Rubrivirga marina]